MLYFLCPSFVVCLYELERNNILLDDREGKYGHTCVVALQNGTLSFNGARQVRIKSYHFAVLGKYDLYVFLLYLCWLFLGSIYI